MAEYDVIVAGGGHNGLTAAAYLAKAGLNVCVLERNDWVGGGVITSEVTLPGFKHDVGAGFHIFIQPNPLIRNDELGLLSKYGLKYLHPEPGITVVFPDDSSISFYKDIDRTCESIAKISQKDAEAYKRFFEWANPIVDMLFMGMFSPPPPLGALFAQLEQNEIGQELMRALMMSGMAVINEWFEDERVKACMMRFVSEAIVSPDDNGTGYYLLVMIPVVHRFGLQFPEGGSGALSEALARCIKANGGTIRTGATVKSIKVAGGQAKGVLLESGEEITARKAVVCDLNIKQIFPGMIGGAQVDPNFTRKVQRLHRPGFMGLIQSLALNEAPKYKAGDEADKAGMVEFCSWLEPFRKAFDGFKYGVPDVSMPLAGCHTVTDPTRAPDGKHTLYLFHYEPFETSQGTWAERKQEVADGILNTLSQHTTNMGPENILGRHIVSPPEFEKWNASWPGGDATHFGSYLYQSMGNRPLPGWSQFRMPVERLYLVGPSAYPGLGCTGGARSAVPVLLEDMGIDLEKVIG